MQLKGKIRLGASQVVQRASLASADMDLQEAFDDAMADGDEEEIRKIEALMGPWSGMPKTIGASDDDSRDYNYKGTQVRFSFAAGLREKLMKAQTTAGNVACGLGALCYVSPNSAIALTGGKEIWSSKGGTPKATAPPIDHYSPDWKDRLVKLEADAKKGNWDVAKYREEGIKLYNQPPLRVIHMFCNSKRPKA